jgi:hypothetical protein
MGLQPAGRMRPAATYTNYVHAVEITQEFRLLYQLFFSRAAREPAHNGGCGHLPLKCWTSIMETLDYYRMQSDLGFRISDTVLQASRPC